jgi:hypothetical protein
MVQRGSKLTEVDKGRKQEGEMRRKGLDMKQCCQSCTDASDTAFH